MRAISKAVRDLVPVLGGLWLSGCAGTWARAPLTEGALPRREHVQVWTGRQSRDWHAVRITTDSISGVPFFQHPDCDSCRVSVPRAAVDSVLVGGEFVDAGTRFFFGAVVFAFTTLFVGLGACAASHCLD